MNEVKVKILNVQGLELPKYAYEGDAGMDICSAEDILIFPGNTIRLKTNIAVELPEGYAFEVSPRSGIDTFTKLRVRLGTIDCQYRGFIGVTVDNISQASLSSLVNSNSLSDDCDYVEVQDGLYLEVRDTGDTDPDFHGAYQIRKGDRIAQLKLKVVPKCLWEVIDKLSESERSTGGFGHTGVLEGDDGWDPNEDPLDDEEYNTSDNEVDYLDEIDEDEESYQSSVTIDGRHLVKEQGYLIDYEHIYSAQLMEDPNKIVQGYVCFSEFFDNDFAGLLSEDKVALWSVDEDSLELIEKDK